MGDRVVETHSATLYFVGDRVYKRKKALDLGFVDFRTPAARRQACAAEVRLNRRFAPDVYLGVATLTGPGTPWGEPLVVMRRLPDEQRLSEVMRADLDLRPALTLLARQLARVQRESPVPAHLLELGSPDWLSSLWAQGLTALETAGDAVPNQTRERTRALAERYLVGRGPLFERRAAAGRIVDGHGDLLADDVFLTPEGPCVLDCLEFDERLRIGDGLLDAAFLAMDLESKGRADLARCFLDAYRDTAHDDGPGSLEHHFVAYRAHVRSKVACLRASQTGDAADAARAGELADLALAHLESGVVRLVLVGGAPGSGKTTLATRLGSALPAVVLSSDVTRKRLHGLDPATPVPAPPGEGLYDETSSGRTYAALMTQARELLVAGESVVIDASFTDASHRAAARSVALTTASDLTELCCVVDEAVAQTRLGARGPGVSDATPSVRTWMVRHADSWPQAVALDTSSDLETSLRQALEQVLGPCSAGAPSLGAQPVAVAR